MQRILLGVISVDFDATGQLLIIYSAFVKYECGGNYIMRSLMICTPYPVLFE